MNDYPQEVLKILEKEIRTHGYRIDHGGWVVYQLVRGTADLQVEACDFGYGKNVFVNNYKVGTIL